MEENELTPRQQALIESLDDPIFRHTKWEGRQSDWVLQWAVRFVESTSLGIGVTLTVGGGVISGTMVSSKLYFESLSEDMSKSFSVFGNEAAETIKTLMLSFDNAEDHQDGAPAEQYIHLKDARMFTTPNGALTSNGALWRGKISAVHGFTFGETKAS